MRCFLIAALSISPALSALPLTAIGQSVDLTVNDVGLSIGDSRRVTGLRINYRDRRMEEVNGVNITLWTPYRENRGVVNGVALGIPMTGARRIVDVGAGIFGVAAMESLHGLGIGGIGVGAGEDIEGIAIGGIGMGVGRDMRGLAVGGIGMGVGRDVRGIAVGGIGMGVGGDLRGAAISGIGSGIGGSMVGLGVGGIGLGVGGNGRGIIVGGIGAGIGGDMTGLSVGGVTTPATRRTRGCCRCSTTRERGSHSFGSIATTASADVMTGRTSKSMMSFHFDIHSPSNAGSSQSMT